VLTTASRIFKYGIANRKGTGISINYVSVLERQKETSGEQTETGEKLYVGLHEVTEKEVLNPEEIKRVILATKPGFYRTVIQTAIYTGARVSEILALRWDDVDLDNSTVYIRRSMSTARVKGEAGQERVRWFDPKTTRGTRTIPVDMDLTRSLKSWKEKCPKSRLDLVFSNEFGEPLGPYRNRALWTYTGTEPSGDRQEDQHAFVEAYLCIGSYPPRQEDHASIKVSRA